MGILKPRTSAEFDADSDANTLMQAVAIKKDKKRLQAARKVIKAKLENYKAVSKTI